MPKERKPATLAETVVDFRSLQTSQFATRLPRKPSAWPFVSEFWSSTTAGFGWNHAQAPDRPSDSPFLPDSSEEVEAKKDIWTHKIRVLVIEDNPIDQMVITDVVKTCGFPFDLLFAADGETALSLLQELQESDEYPSLILLDLNLPKISGSEILRYIRNSSRYSRIPVVVVTSSDAPRDVTAIAEAGATAYFLKPTKLANYVTLRDVILGVLRSGQPL